MTQAMARSQFLKVIGGESRATAAGEVVDHPGHWTKQRTKKTKRRARFTAGFVAENEREWWWCASRRVAQTTASSLENGPRKKREKEERPSMT